MQYRCPDTQSAFVIGSFRHGTADRPNGVLQFPHVWGFTVGSGARTVSSHPVSSSVNLV